MEASNTKKERNKPCEQCRFRKVKCTVEEGSAMCTRCVAQGVACVFSNNVPYERKRPSPAAGDIYPPPMKRRHSGRESTRSDGSLLSPASNDPFNGRDDSVPANSLLNRTVGLAKVYHAKHIGPSSAFPRSLFDLTPNRTAYQNGDVRHLSQEEYVLTVRDATTRDYERDFTYLDEIEACVAPHGLALINLYFRIVHPAYPILHKKVFYEKYARTYREFSPPLLAAVYIQALQWWEYGRELAGAQKPNEEKLKHLAHDSLSGVCHRPKLSTVQALLLLAQTHDAVNWLLLAQTANVAFELGLHLDCTHWVIPAWEKGLRKRLAWAVFMQDVWGALVSGRPTVIHGSDWLVQQVTEGDFPERSEDQDEEEGSTEVEKGRELFTQFIRLSLILGRILKGFWTLKAREESLKGDLLAAMDKAKPLQMALKDWYTDLPNTLNLANIQARKLCSVGYLHLGYWAVQVTLDRALLSTSTHAYGSGMCDYELIASCQKTAEANFTAAASLISKLRPEHLQSFWYFASSHSLSLIAVLGCELWSVNLEHGKRAVILKGLEDFRWTLRISAKGAIFLTPAVESLNQMLQVLQEAQAEQFTQTYHDMRSAVEWPNAETSYTVPPVDSAELETGPVVDSYFYPHFTNHTTFSGTDYYNR